MTFGMRILTGDGDSDGGDHAHGHGLFPDHGDPGGHGRDQSRVRVQNQNGGWIFSWKGAEAPPHVEIDLARGAPNGDGRDGGSHYLKAVEVISAQRKGLLLEVRTMCLFFFFSQHSSFDTTAIFNQFSPQ